MNIFTHTQTHTDTHTHTHTHTTRLRVGSREAGAGKIGEIFDYNDSELLLTVHSDQKLIDPDKAMAWGMATDVGPHISNQSIEGGFFKRYPITDPCIWYILPIFD